MNYWLYPYFTKTFLFAIPPTLWIGCMLDSQVLVALTYYHPFFSNFLFTNLFSIKFRYFFIISSLFPYFNLFVSIFIQSYANIKFTPYNRLSGQQMISGTQIISTHTEWQVGISLTFFFHFIYFLDFKFMSDLLHYKWEICIPNMTV